MRYAIYFAPTENDPLTLAAESWLGRSAYGRAVSAEPGDLDPSFHKNIVAFPLRYGFHATLRAPFHLNEGISEDLFIAHVDQAAQQIGAISIDRIVVGQLGAFFALVPGNHTQALRDWAQGIVEAIEPMRGPLAPGSLEKHRKKDLTDRQKELLLRWGYPYTEDEFNFHMTLTGPVPNDKQTMVSDHLTTRFAAFTNRSLALDRLVIFREVDPTAPFTIIHAAALGQQQAAHAQ